MQDSLIEENLMNKQAIRSFTYFAAGIALGAALAIQIP
jgi:hypothetical protein